MPDLLLVHVVAGAAGLLLGPLWLLARPAGAARALAAAYLVAVAGVAVTGGALALARPGLAWLLPVAVLTGAMAGAGAVARARRWPLLQAHLLGGSYIALVTALLVVRTGSPVAWVLPALVGQLPIAVAGRRLVAAQGRRSTQAA
ncbi:hypothetical protein [Blastococcus sp. SYSU D00820]